MKTDGTNLLVLKISAFWSPWPPRWAPEVREVSHKVVVIDRFHCISGCLFRYSPFCYPASFWWYISHTAGHPPDQGTIWRLDDKVNYYTDIIMGAIASHTTSLTIVYSSVYLDADGRKHQSSASLAFVWGIHRRPVNSPHKWPVTRIMFPFDDVIMIGLILSIPCDNTVHQIIPVGCFFVITSEFVFINI